MAFYPKSNLFFLIYKIANIRIVCSPKVPSKMYGLLEYKNILFVEPLLGTNGRTDEWKK